LRVEIIVRCHLFLLPVILLIAVTASIQVSIIQVPGDSTTIQGGINGALDGDTVMVYPGTYTENINFNGRGLSLRVITS
jgi:hypothetical protein